MGCHQGLLRSTTQHICLFARDGFTQDGRFFVPCGTTYHIGCIKVGEPFRTRLPAGRGLAYPKVVISPSFICEACTVRAQIGGELRKSGGHLTLLMLERMRLIDQANAWSASSHAVYQGDTFSAWWTATEFGRILQHRGASRNGELVVLHRVWQPVEQRQW